MFVVKLLHPTILTLIGLCPRILGIVLLGILSGIMAVDLAATVSTIVKLNRRLEQIDKLAAKIKEASNEFGEDLAEKVLNAAERGAGWKEAMDELSSKMALRRDEPADGMEELGQLKEEQRAQVRRQLEEWRANLRELLEKDSFGSRRLLSAFPQLRSIDHKDTLERLRQWVKHRK